MIYREPTLFPDLSAAENIFMGRQPRRSLGRVDHGAVRAAAVLFISHRLEEIFELCQRVTTLRDGSWIASEPVAGLTEDDLVRRMVGRDLAALYPKQTTETFKAGDLGTFTIGDKGTVLLGDPTVFNASNIDQFNF